MLVAGGISPATAADVTVFEVVTAIRAVNGAVQVGEKSRQTVVVDNETRAARMAFETGKTMILGLELDSVRDAFTAERTALAGDVATFAIRGQTASGIAVLPDIDYALKLVVNFAKRTIVVTGCHDAYPSYSIRIGSTTVYDREQTGFAATGLAGTCDAKISLKGLSF